MTKRFKPGACVLLTDGDVLNYVGPGVAEVRSGPDAVRLSAEDIRRIQAADLLEDVPEPKTPGQHLFAVEMECGVRSGVLWNELTDYARSAYEAAARRLGIKPEGE